MCICVRERETERDWGPHRLQTLMSVFSLLGNPVIVTLLSSRETERDTLSLHTHTKNSQEKIGKKERKAQNKRSDKRPSEMQITP